MRSDYEKLLNKYNQLIKEHPTYEQYIELKEKVQEVIKYAEEKLTKKEERMIKNRLKIKEKE